jgi:hypothetical protein
MLMAGIKSWECDPILALTLVHAPNRIVERRTRRSRPTIVMVRDCANLAWLDEGS